MNVRLWRVARIHADGTATLARMPGTIFGPRHRQRGAAVLIRRLRHQGRDHTAEPQMRQNRPYLQDAA